MKNKTDMTSVVSVMLRRRLVGPTGDLELQLLLKKKKKLKKIKSS